jgi:hypothetical protein
MQVQELMKDAVIGTIVPLDDPEQGLESITDWAAVRKVSCSCSDGIMTEIDSGAQLALQTQYGAGSEECVQSRGGTCCGR